MKPPLPALFLMGPTASGKTALAVALAQQLDGEVVSVDSALVYRGMDIGTAKPTRDEMAGVPHHLIDIIDPTDSYSAAQFHADAMALIEDIAVRGKLPILAGGTMLYFKALEEGLSDLPQADAQVRARLDAEAAERGWPALHQRLAELDAATAARLAPADSQRIQRALEVWELSGKPMSELIARGREGAPALNLLKLALLPHDRAWLHARIALRFEKMLEAGFLAEVEALRERWTSLSLELPSMRCVGYRQAWEYLDGQIDRTGLIAKGVAATRQLAKRQLTWMRSMENLVEIDCQQADLVAPALAAARAWRAGLP
ncbi:tRNA (adenosine(37)-N6)-dimethylallyltransferase MiaA [Crenobacter cavernae]|uniref:tRNA dimethylallyltransferase n=1 Tax=Crenobacter cavernae TaxID=2290923 RepID=A0A345Y277_9NEIS|nr:tRNA (adenosine(37)-N6)-dimethylallyltransferase MiaA [Crenobacter cavernae]AXK38029.1 tRNA (adenosine(37)-N6)-dimethylallyltransferase MiaA [Crenobacter cavernae]